MHTFKSHKANTIGEDVYEHLKRDIINLAIKPGQTLTEQEICEKYGISRTPSRDVLQRLRNDGLVVAIPYKANYVSMLNYDTIKQLIFMRIVLETKVIQEAMAAQHDLLVAALEINLKQQELLLKGSFEAEAFYELDSAFHKTWFELAKKDVVWDQIQKSQVHYTRFRMLDIVLEKNVHAIFDEHRALFELIKNKEVHRIEAFITEHLKGGMLRLGDKLFNEYADYFDDHA